MSHKVTVKPNKSVRLPTAGKYCDRDIIVTGDGSEIRSKVYTINLPSAVAATDVTVVTGDSDVAAHYADDSAMVTVRKMTNNSSIGTAILVQTNHGFPTAYGFYMNYNATANNAATIAGGAGTLSAPGSTTSTPYVYCTASGNIVVHPQRTNNNFGGADYIITFSW